MGHLAAVWNLTSALGGSPRFGRANFPIDPGLLPASLVVKLAPFGDALLQYCIHVERPLGSNEPEGAGFEPELSYQRGATADRLTPMAVDYATIGMLYAAIEDNLRALVATHMERFEEIAAAAASLDQSDPRAAAAARITAHVAQRANKGLAGIS